MGEVTESLRGALAETTGHHVGHAAMKHGHSLAQPGYKPLYGVVPLDVEEIDGIGEVEHECAVILALTGVRSECEHESEGDGDAEIGFGEGVREEEVEG